MKFYLAPMEAITGYIFRNAYMEYFHDMDQYFTPFVSGKKLGSKERNDLLPEHNEGMDLVPQILTNRSEDFIAMATYLHEQYDYQVVNLNLGCPAGTVVAKKRGAGMLAGLKELEHFLDEIYQKSPVEISLKTRIGIDDLDEWEDIVALYNQYPVHQLIVHPRLQKEFYSGTPHYEIYEKIQQKTLHRICYNGDIRTPADYQKICEMFPDTQSVMLGRGVLANPSLVREIQGGPRADKETLRGFHDSIYRGYQEIMSGDRNTLFKMKELWTYLITSFEESDKYLKKIKKSEKCLDYELAVQGIFRDLELKK